MNRFFILVIIAITLVACKKEDDDFVPNAAVNKQSLQFSSSSGIDSFAITSNASWTVEKDVNWITLSKTSGNANEIIKISVTENTVATPRTAVITVKVDGLLPDIKIDVNQSKALETVGLFILSEGPWRSGTSDISYYDVKTEQLTQNYYSQKNSKALGDGANDLAIYGSKLYCVVTGGSEENEGYVEVINSVTGESIERVEVDSPRRIIFYGSKAYVTTYSQKVVRLDTALLSIDATANLSGTYAEGICLYNDKLYICNSGQGYGTTISVVTLNPFNETDIITVPQNPIMIEATSSGEIYFTTADLSWAGGDPSNIHILDPEQKQVTSPFDVRASKIALAKDFIYAVDFDWGDFSDHINKINLQTKTVENISNIFEDYSMVYNVSINPLNGDIYLTNQGDNVVVFDKTGAEKFDLKTGIAITATVVPVIK
ncbi:MAG: BACON domain-containing protein [Prevotellaceae bacterium]|jgi:hypothetical protein|nr:BACON domain-containing protein [Prevotellaceae bacterium]